MSCQADSAGPGQAAGRYPSEATTKKEGKRKKRKKKGASQKVAAAQPGRETDLQGNGGTQSSGVATGQEEEAVSFSFKSYILGNANDGEQDKEPKESKVSEATIKQGAVCLTETEIGSQTETNTALRQEQAHICLLTEAEVRPKSNISEGMQTHEAKLATKAYGLQATVEEKELSMRDSGSEACASFPLKCTPAEASLLPNTQTKKAAHLVKDLEAKNTPSEANLSQNESKQHSETALFPQTAAETVSLTDSAPNVDTRADEQTNPQAETKTHHAPTQTHHAPTQTHHAPTQTRSGETKDNIMPGTITQSPGAPGSDLHKQLSPQREADICPPSPSCASARAHLTLPESSPALSLALALGQEQPADHSQADGSGLHTPEPETTPRHGQSIAHTHTYTPPPPYPTHIHTHHSE